MFKIDKDLNNIPSSLLSLPTHQKRQKHIAAKKYITGSRYNESYKEKDIKETLEKIHYNKCAYCEVWVEEYHIEHFRPKSIYYWLAYSWDNLLLACPTCNRSKLDQFPCKNANCTTLPQDIDPTDTSEENIKKINLLSEELNRQEQPLLINPELESPIGKLQFEENGTIKSSDERYTETINVCKLNRNKLTLLRKKIFDDLINKIKAELVTSDSIQEQCKNISKLFNEIKRKSLDRSECLLTLLVYISENFHEIVSKNILK